MYYNCVNERSAEKQRRLEQSFLELLQTKLYDDISVSELCEKSGVSRKTFYRLFDSKADVLYALVDHTLMDFESFVTPPDVKEGEFHRFLAYLRCQKPLLDALIKNNISTLLTERSLRLILTENKENLQLFGIKEDDYTREMMLFYFSGMFSLFLDWHISGFARPIDEMCDILNNLMSRCPLEMFQPK